MSDILTIGNASQLADDDIARDVNMQRSPALAHKEIQELRRDTTTHYGGHLIWKDSTELLAIDDSLDYTDTNASRLAVSSTIITSLAGKYPGSLQNLIKGALLWAFASFQVHGGKIAVGTSLSSRLKYAVEYGAVPAIWNIIASAQMRAQVAGILQYVTGSAQIVVPVQWVNDVPYITWNVTISHSSMDTNSNYYRAQGNLYLQGFTV